MRKMKTFLMFVGLLALSLQAEEKNVELTSTSSGGCRNEKPQATYESSNNILTVLSPDDVELSIMDADGNVSDALTAGNQVTMSVPSTCDGFVVTVRTADGSTFDGVFSRSGASTVTLTDRQALQLAKNRRQSGGSANYYAGVVSSIVSDSLLCHIPAPPTQTWATGTADKWLVFVDEEPNLGWSHMCSYYYFPKTVTTSDSLPSLGYDGQMPPRQVSLIPVEINQSFSLSDFRTLPQPFVNGMSATPVCNPSSHEVKVVILGSVGIMEVHPLLTHYRNWNECAAIYTILRTKYGIPDSDISLLIGNADGTISDPDDIYGELPLPKDLDGDGIDENIIGFTEDNLRTVIANLAEEQSHHQIKHLMVFFAGDLNQRDNENVDFKFELSGNDPFDGNAFSKLLYQVGADNVSCIYSCNHSWRLACSTSATHRVITASASNNYALNSSRPHPLHEEYSAFGYYWISALAGKDLATGNTINTDGDGDGFSSFSELYHYADSAYSDYFWNNPIEGIAPWSIIMPYPSITSSPVQLKDSLSVTHMPPYSYLSIKRASDTEGMLKWDSPDIWVRNQNDGLTNQTSEHIKLSSGNPIYVYVRIRCSDVPNIESYDRFIDLIAVPSGIEYTYQPRNYETLYEEIGFQTIGDIAADSSAIYTFVWNWDQIPDPDEVTDPDEIVVIDWQALYEASGNMLPVQFVAYLGDLTDSEMLYYNLSLNPDTSFTLPVNKHTIQKKVAIRPLNGKSFVVSNPPMMPKVHKGSEFTFQLKTADAGRYSIEVLPDQAASSGTVLSNSFRTFLTLSAPLTAAMDSVSTVTAVTAINGTAGKYRLNNASAAFSGLNLQGNSNYELTLSSDVLSITTFSSDVDWRYHIVLRDSSGTIIDGQAVRVYQEGEGIGGGIMGAPHVQSVKGQQDSYVLTETAVSEPARYEWYDVEMEKIDDGKTVTVNRQQVGDACILKVTMSADGREEYAVAQLDGVVGIQRVSPVPFDGTLTVTLTAGADSGMSLRVIAVSGTTTPIEVAIPEGQNEVAIPTASLPDGQYAVCLMHNGGIVQSVNVVK